jgi:hypothetical protein
MRAKFTLILEILGEQEMLAVDIVARSNGELRRRTLFDYLGRMQELGIITSSPEPETTPGMIPRSLFRRMPVRLNPHAD